MNIYLILIACCLIAACQSTPAPTLPSRPPIIQNEPIVASTDPSKSLVIVGRLVSIQDTLACGLTLFSAIAEYTDLQVITGTYPYDVIYVIHDCPDLKRSEYAQGKGDLESFIAGEYHELHLGRANIAETAEPLNVPHLSNRLYFCNEVNLHRKGPTVAPKPEHPMGEALEGVYYVGWGSLDRTYDIGTLTLKGDLYSFTPLIPIEQIPKTAADRFFFLRNPEGHYSVKYQDPVDENTLLEDLSGFTFLALIQFSVPARTTETTVDWNGEFYIASSQENKSLLFHSVYNEFQLWGVGKSWD